MRMNKHQLKKKHKKQTLTQTKRHTTKENQLKGREGQITRMGRKENQGNEHNKDMYTKTTQIRNSGNKQQGKERQQ